MLGAGVFTAIGPAAGAAGSLLLVGLVLAGAVAYCNAMSSAWLAARYPESGGTYVYGRARLGPAWGALAGWAFVIGKAASCAAMHSPSAHMRGLPTHGLWPPPPWLCWWESITSGSSGPPGRPA